MTATETFEQVVARELSLHCATRQDGARQYGAALGELWALIDEQARGGKLLRPRLFAHMHAALGGTLDRDVVVDAATSIELLHLAFLMHDDVIDGDVVRRGRPNLIGRLRTAHRGRGSSAADAARAAAAGGILAGDTLLTDALLRFARVRLAPDHRARLLDLVDRTVTETIAGEVADVFLGTGGTPADMPSVLAMSEQKTAAYTIELPMLAAAVLADAGQPAETALSRVARSLGLAFQLQDDLLSAFGDPSEHGKDAASDLREGKVTPLVAFARDTDVWPSIEPLLGDAELTEEGVQRIRAALVSCGAAQHVSQLAASALADARQTAQLAVRAGELPHAAWQVVDQLAARLDGRRT